jgi:hypothetical protein
LGESDDGRAPPRAVREVNEDIDVVHGLQVLTGIRYERGLEMLSVDSISGAVPGSQLSALTHPASLPGQSVHLNQDLPPRFQG